MSIVCCGSFAPRSSILDQSFDESAGLRQLCRQVFGHRRMTTLVRGRQSKLSRHRSRMADFMKFG